MKTINAKSAPLRQLSWSIALVCAMLVSQFAGQLHRIDHSRWLGGQAAQAAQAQDPASSWTGYGDATHSCIALDAATLADVLSNTLQFATPVFAPFLPAFIPSCRQWDAPFKAHFHSRGPPALT